MSAAERQFVGAAGRVSLCMAAGAAVRMGAAERQGVVAAGAAGR